MPKERPLWPMKWIILAIILIIVPYTFLTLHYRKPGPAFRPYEDMKNRANVARLLAAGYQRLPIQAQRQVDAVRVPGGATIEDGAGGLPPDLRSTLVEAPVLPLDILALTAAPTASTLQPYVIQLTCTLPNDRVQLAGAELYMRDERLVFSPTFAPIAGDLQQRSPQSVVLLTVPAGALKAGRYDVFVVAERSSRRWSLEVK